MERTDDSDSFYMSTSNHLIITIIITVNGNF